MATSFKFKRENIGKTNSMFNQIRTIIETPFYKNNVTKITSLKEAYKLAKNSSGTIVTDLPVYKPELLGLENDSKILIFNDGKVHGRCAAARRILGEDNVDTNEYSVKIREAIYNTRNKKMYHAESIIGLDKDFSVKAHLLIPEGDENIMYSWLLNFSEVNTEIYKMYNESNLLQNEGDIYIFSDPQWKSDEHPMGLTFFDPQHNCAAILGMRYFGEFKKGTLTLSWGIANRNGYACCHGGQKRYNLDSGKSFVAGVFGLSGSGKSTITHARHNGKYDITVLHDDAFIISTKDGSSVALEPSYFDKTQDYPTSSEDNKYLLTMQNCGATLDDDGKIVPVTEDIRNGNGRAIKSILWSENRVNKLSEPINAIFWIMKDPTLPPILKINNESLAASMGATLATKRTTAEMLLKGVDPNALVFEPYANPFRTYPLSNDYKNFKELIKTKNVDCYILNTGEFMGKNIDKEITLDILEKIVENKSEFYQWGNFTDITYMEIEGFTADFLNDEYKNVLKQSFINRAEFIKSKKTLKSGFDALPQDALQSILKVIEEI